MAARIQQARPLHLFRICLEGLVAPKALRHRGSAQAAKKIGHYFGVSGQSEKALDTCAGKRWEKISHIHLQHNFLIDVRRDESMDRSPLDEPMRGGMRRNSVENPRQNGALNLP